MSSRIGVIGLGPMGRRHCEAVKMILDGEIVAVCDLLLDKVNLIKDEYSVKNGYYNFEEMLEKQHLDLLIVATNGPSHAELVIKAAKKGIKRILCEKPMATKINDAKAMNAICKANKVRLAVNHARRWLPSYQRLKTLLGKGVIGDIKNITFEMAGGQLASNGGHFWDLVRFLTDDEPASVIGFIDKTGTPHPRGKQFEDPGAFGLILMKKGTRIFFDMSEDYGVPFFMEIMGTVGRILIDEKACKWKVYARKQVDRDQPFTRRLPLERISFEGERMDMIESCKNAINELLDNCNIRCTGVDGLKSLEMTVAVHKSERNNNQTVTIPLSESDNEMQYKFT
tara:strand:- start:458 stop:1477 length:1020 start_codon:yes stop_codon:yes gene_type:complete